MQEAPTSSQPQQTASGRSQPAASDTAADVTSSAEAVFPGAKTWAELGATVVFEKVLTSSDINPQGRIVVPKANAEKHLPYLERQAPSQVHAVDTLGNPVVFKFRFWINNQSRMYLLEGTQKIRATYQLGPGDVIQFGKNADGQLIVAGRKGTSGDLQRKAPRSAANVNPAPGSKPPATAKRKRGSSQQGEPNKAVQFSVDAVTYYFEPIKDGVFRAVPDGASDDSARVVKHNGVWSVVLNVCGELYQAYFDSSAAAFEAFNAAGMRLPDA